MGCLSDLVWEMDAPGNGLLGVSNHFFVLHHYLYGKLIELLNNRLGTSFFCSWTSFKCRGRRSLHSNPSYGRGDSHTDGKQILPYFSLTVTTEMYWKC